MPPRNRNRTKACTLPDGDVDSLLSAHVMASKLTPNKIFAYSAKSKRQACKEWREFLSALLDKTGGRILRQKKWHAQLRCWLENQGKAWCWTDSEKAAYGLRQMLQVLLKRKSDFGRAPNRFKELDTLVGKVHVSDNEGEELANDDNDHDDDANSDPDTDSCVEVEILPRHVGAPCVQVSSDSDWGLLVLGEEVTTQSLRELEMALYPSTPQKKRITAKTPEYDLMSPPKFPGHTGAISAQKMSGIVAKSLFEVAENAPLPSSYRFMSNQGWRKGKRKQNRGQLQRSTRILRSTMTWACQSSRQS